MAEKDWYPRIQRFLEKKGYICSGYYKGKRGKTKKFDFTDTGIGNVRIDVFGVKRPSSKRFNFQIETIGVEVKDWSKISIREMRQARSYSELCTRCYLAAPVKKFTETEKKYAADLGIGLIRLGKQIEVIVESKRFENDSNLINQLLMQLNIVFCATCRTYKDRYSPNEPKYYGGSWRFDIFSSSKSPWRWTYICKECNDKFSKNAKRYLEERDLSLVWDEIDKLKAKIKSKANNEDIDYLWAGNKKIRKQIKNVKKRNKKYSDSWGYWLENKFTRLNRKLNKLR